jgi:hypothetical protein
MSALLDRRIAVLVGFRSLSNERTGVAIATVQTFPD